MYKNEKNNIHNRVVDYLNKKTNSHFQPRTKATRQHIDARVAEGFSPEDFKTVIDFKCQQWIQDPKMQEYLRPKTLFNSNFEGYLNAAKRSGAPPAKPTGPTKTPEERIKEMLS